MKYLFLLASLVIVGIVKAFSQDTTRLSLLFVGDIMQHDSQIQSAFNPTTGKYEYDSCFRFVKPYFESVDITIGNLELTLGGAPYKGYPQFSAPDELAATLKDAGVDVLVTANNHSLDRGRRGLERTITKLDSLRFLHTGTFRDSLERMNEYPLLIPKNGFTIALLNYTYGTNGIRVIKPNMVNLLDTALIRRDLLKAKSLQPDFIIVFTHWGLEYQSQPSVDQKRIGEFCFRMGANAVIGSHPHVLQPMEWRREDNQLLVYSLGNFVSGQRDRYKNGGGMVRLDLLKVKTLATSICRIDSANYLLQWIYKKPIGQKKIYVLPIPSFEQDTTVFITDPISLNQFRIFIEDSRKLLNNYNVNMVERTKAEIIRK
ncbi:MAG: CapA family protein [Cyclobacteriaceae bacterium]|nr:CapA family protein [Cyclobacteriaceae bacterium]